MFRVRFHGRGGQGVKTASRVLGSAFFREGYDVQDAPRYGAERRGAPIFAYVRARHGSVFERGIIREPDLVVVVDDTLMAVSAAGVLQGIDAHTGLLVATETSADLWRERLRLPGPIVTVACGRAGKQSSLTMAAAAARWVGVISRTTLMDAVRDEIAPLGQASLRDGYRSAELGYDELGGDTPLSPRDDRAALQLRPPAWIDVEATHGKAATPSIFAEATSTAVRTGLWRTVRPVIEPEQCRQCWWVCSSFCPDGAIRVENGSPPTIDLDHCKGCAICAVQCPHHAIQLRAEAVADTQEAWS